MKKHDDKRAVTGISEELQREDEEPPQLIAAERDDISEAAFLESCKKGSPNLGLIVLEIGKWCARKNYPENPPGWALKKCKEFYESSEISTRPLFSPSLGPAGYPGDGQLLERVADLLIELHLHPEGPSPKKSVSLRSAIKRALQEAGKSKDIDVDIRRLTRLWKMDEDYRSQRAVARYVKKRTGTETAFDKKENPRRGK